MYDLVIIGGGPAGAAAAVYAARKRLKSAVIVKEFGGQSVVSEDIQNWIGTPSISGSALAEQLKQHVLAVKGDILEIIEGKTVTGVSRKEEHFSVTTDGGATLEGKAVLVTTGSERKKLSVPGADTYDNKGVSYCASCDGPLFSGKDVLVVGGGNAGFETAAQLLAYCKSVTLLHKNATYKADPVTVEKVLAHPNMHGVTSAMLKEIKGGQFVTSVVYTDATGKDVEIPAEGVFAEIGHIPATDFVKNLVTVNEFGNIVTDTKTQRTSVDGVWAAGDCTDGLYHQNNIAAGDAVKAVEDLYLWLKAK